MSNNNYIDAHLHLQDNRLDGLREDFIGRAEASGVTVMICNATRENDWLWVANLAKKNSTVKPFYGVHPWFSDQVEGDWLERLSALLRHGGGIGEIGLDRSRKINIKIQEFVFRSQLDIAIELKRPVTIHCIKWWGRLLDILKDYDLADSGILLHSFSGSKEVLFKFLDLGAYISFSTCLADRSKGRELQQIFKDVPLNRLLLETDSPDQFCADLQSVDTLNEKTILNEPAQVVKLYEFASRLRKIDIDLLRKNIWENGQIFTR